MIQNAKDRPLALQAAGLPNMADGMSGLMQPLTFVRITKQNLDGLVQEIENKVCARGTRYPMKPQDVALKPEGQRIWRWETILAGSDLILRPDDIIRFDGRPYRVMDKHDWKEYGLVQYDITQDFVEQQ